MELKEFIKQYRSEINALNFEEVYYQASRNLKDRGSLTDLFYKIGVDPLKALDYIPEYFLLDSRITSFVIPSHIKMIKDGAFYNCSKLKSITIPDSITSIGEGALAYCSGLTSITIPDNVTSIGYQAFSGCESLTNIKIPSSLTIIERDVFENCDNLTKLTYAGTKEQWKNIQKDEAWNRNSSIEKIVCIDGEVNL